MSGKLRKNSGNALCSEAPSFELFLRESVRKRNRLRHLIPRRRSFMLASRTIKPVCFPSVSGFSCRTYLNSTTPQLYVGGMNDSAKRSSEGRNLKCGSEGVQVYSERSVRLKRFAVAIANGTLSRYAAALHWRYER